MDTIKAIVSSPVVWQIVVALILLALIVVVVAMVRRPLVKLFSQVAPVIPSGQSAPVQGQSKPHRLGGMNATIAFTHRTVSQIIGLEMSAANLLAVFLSVTCAVAGAFILAYSYYQSIFIPSIAALAMFVLALLIENITLSSLKNIRLSNTEIQKQDDEYYDTLNKQLNDQLTETVIKKAKQQDLQMLTKEEVKDRKRAHKQEQREQKALVKQKRNLVKQRTRRARRDRNASIPFAAVGICFSAVAGGLFWHQVLAGLDMRLNLGISTMFALAVSVTFILGELFKRVQDEAIKEAMGNNELQQEMLKQQADDISMETMIETMNAVRVDPIAKQEMLDAMKIEFVKMIKLASEQSTKRLLAGSQSVSSDVPVSPVIVSEEICEGGQKTQQTFQSNLDIFSQQNKPSLDPIVEQVSDVFSVLDEQKSVDEEAQKTMQNDSTCHAQSFAQDGDSFLPKSDAHLPTTGELNQLPKTDPDLYAVKKAKVTRKLYPQEVIFDTETDEKDDQKARSAKMPSSRMASPRMSNTRLSRNLYTNSEAARAARCTVAEIEAAIQRDELSLAKNSNKILKSSLEKFIADRREKKSQKVTSVQ